MTHLKPNRPLFVVGIVVALTVGVRVISIALHERTGQVDARVNLAENQAQQVTERQRQQQVTAFLAVADGEVSRTEERIREATALATAASLFAASESLNKRIPATVSALLSGVSAGGLMPPGLRLLDTQGEVTSVRSRLLVRYRPEPLGVEVISLGQLRLDGPVLLVRVPDNGITEEQAGVYVATQLDEITVPDPFATAGEIVALGFAPEPLRAAKLPNAAAIK